MNKKINLIPVKLALETLRRNKGRTVLTILGIVIGITAVITVLSTGQAIKALIIGEVQSYGTNYVQVETKTPSTSQQSTQNSFSMVGGSVVTTLKISDAEAIKRLPNISDFYAGSMSQKIATYENVFKKVMIFGTNASFVDIDKSKIELGRFFTEEENDALSKVAVLGADIKDKLFSDSDPVNQYITIDNEKFKVIGTLQKRGASLALNMDEMIFLPVKTLQKRLAGIDYVSFIFAELKDSNLASNTAADITDLLRQRHRITDPDKDDFAVTTMEQSMDMLNTIIYGIQILLIALGSISLIVGGVGIMNIMYVSVTERTFEIGLRKAVGAKKGDILWQFLIEAIIVTMLGGIIGMVVGIILSFLIAIIAQSQGFNWPFTISWPGMLLALLMSTIVGMIFGIYPAKQAAKKNPIEALRFE